MGRPPLQLDAERTCTKCKVTKPVDGFYRRGNRAQDSLHSHCRDCQKAARTIRHRLVRYGVSSERYAELLASSQGVCEICGGVNPSGRALHIDHHHGTGRVRGLLCGRCNAMLGFIDENPAIFRAAVSYLEER